MNNVDAAVRNAMAVAVERHAAGHLDEAAALYRAILAITPDDADAHHLFGIVALQSDDPAGAETSIATAIRLRPGVAAYHANFGIALARQGRYDAALASLSASLAIEETAEARREFVACVKHGNITRDDPHLRSLLVRALREAWDRPVDLVAPITRLVTLDPAAMPHDELLQALIVSTPICGVALERALTAARSVLLDRAEAGEAPDTATLAFWCALARQCFINEYVFAYADDEIGRVRALCANVTAALARGTDVPAAWIAAVGAYVPLHTLAHTRTLLERDLPEPLAQLIAAQVAEPLEEERLRAGIPRLTPIAGETTLRVRAQYEENPYPRWIHDLAVPGAPSIGAWLRSRLPFARFTPIDVAAEQADVLIAGCGTGRQAIEAALRFPGAQILAVDLSLASLAYAQRKTNDIGLATITYAQADLTALRTIGRTFHLIESVGVLHHLDDPIGGWRVLAGLLRPGGIMSIGLYSEYARRTITAAQHLARDRGYGPDAGSIRRFRQEVIAADDDRFAAILNLADFYTTSECRDLLFHAREHRFTIPQIAQALDDLGLRFIGFDLDPQTLSEFARTFPGDATRSDLALWERFERDHPDTFVGMYQFYAQKPHEPRESGKAP